MTDPMAAFSTTTVANHHAPVCSQAPLGQSCCCCKRCGVGGCDVRVEHVNGSPGCCLHTRCCPLTEGVPFTTCPVCSQAVRSIRLLPMAFVELDQAQAEAAQTELSGKRGKKRKNLTLLRLRPMATATAATTTGNAEDHESPDLRIGRWTTEETAYCDKLIQFFEEGKLPIPDGIKLNDFLSGMLKSKQARLTKKMKNAKLSARQYRKMDGFIRNLEDARDFSQLETDFFASIRCNMERSEIRFHMQKEWRELFSTYCVAIGQPLDADLWLCSVEEMDRRASQQKDAARMARRKVMMGYALSQDSVNQQHGVFIDPNASVDSRSQNGTFPSSNHRGPASDSDSGSMTGKCGKKPRTTPKLKPLSSYSSPFVGKVIHYMQRRNICFEHVDAWVPSMVPTEAIKPAPTPSSNAMCRLCFAGCGTSDVRVPEDGGPSEPLSTDDKFDLISFGLYSQKFSFDVGCGLPGRVYQSGIPSWEQGIANAPANLFERSGGAKQWGIQTVLGLPISSPKVGRIVVLFYSCIDRSRDDALVARMVDELTKMMPSPQWKLVVDIGSSPETGSDAKESSLCRELLSLIQTYTPADKQSPLAELLPGFTSLRLLLSDRAESDREHELMKAALGFYTAYKANGLSNQDAVWMTARDFMVFSKNHGASGKAPPIPSTVCTTRATGDGSLYAPFIGGTSFGCATSDCASQPPAAAMGVSASAYHPDVLGVTAASQTGCSDESSQYQQQFHQPQALTNRNAQSQGAMYDLTMGLSPALHPITTDMNTDLSALALGLTANQLAALLHSESNMSGT